MATPQEVAEWMFEELKREEYLYQQSVVYDIEQKFGSEFVYYNERGNPAISRDVLKEFRKLTEETVVWERGQRVWRFRESYDSPGRMTE